MQRNVSVQTTMKIKSILLILCISLICGCQPHDTLQAARRRVAQADASYEHAVREFVAALTRQPGRDDLRFELGQLYFSHGQFQKAVEQFAALSTPRARERLGISYFYLGDYTSAHDVFSKIGVLDGEAGYCAGLTAEKLNLFDKALENYRIMKDVTWKKRADERSAIIEKQKNSARIAQVSPAVAAVISNAPSAAHYPQAGALILDCDESVEITPDNRKISRMHYLIKILNERGKQDFSESKIEYDSTFEKIELNFARIIKPDGSIVDVGTRHIRDVSKYLNFPLYSNARVYIISFPEITEGAVIEYSVTITRNQLINKKDFDVTYPVQSKEPVIKARFKVEVPSEKKLFIKTRNEEFNTFGATLRPFVRQETGRTVYTWNFTNIPQIIPEPLMPPDVEVNPTILMTTFNSWQQVYEWWRELATPKMQADATIQEAVQQAVALCKTPEEKARAIHAFCARNIRYVAIEYGEAGYEPHTAADIFRNKYGDCKDQAVLLVTMLRQAGLPAWPVLIPTKDCYNLDPDFPSILFDHCIAAVELDGKTIFMDPTAETCSFGDLPVSDQFRRVLLYKESEYVITQTPLFSSDRNTVEQIVMIQIAPDDTMRAEKTVTTIGSFNQAQRYWLLYTPPQLVEETLATKIQEASIGGKLDSYAIENVQNLSLPVILKYQYHGPEYAMQAGSLRILPQLFFVDVSLTAKPQRTFAIDFGVLESRKTNIEITFPQNFAVYYMSPSVKEDSPWVRFQVAYSQKDNTIICRQEIENKKSLISAEEYPQYKAFMERLARELKQRIILEKKR